MYRLIYLIALFATLGVAAQQMPERGLVRKGNRSYNKGRYNEAIERYGEALKAAPAQFEATYNLGNAFYKAEMFDRAEQTMTKSAADSLRSDTERAEAFYNLGNAQFKQQKYKEALESYKQSLRLNPSDMEAKYNYAYTKRLLDENQNQQNQNQQNQDQNQQQNQDQQGGGQNQQGNNDPQKQDQNGKQKPEDQQQQGQDKQQPSQPEQQQGDKQPGEAQAVPVGISEQEQQQMLDAIQAQEDRTQEKLKEKKGVVVRSKKNW